MMNANKYDSPQTPQIKGERPGLAQSSFSGPARLRELEHLAETARKIRDQAAAELTRGSGAAHHIARERISIAERMLRKTQLEITELRTQLAGVGDLSNAPEAPSTSAKDNELAILLGHSKVRFNQAGDANLPLELQQQHGSSRQYTAARNSSAISHKKTPRSSIMGTLVILALGVGALGLGILALLR